MMCGHHQYSTLTYQHDDDTTPPPPSPTFVVQPALTAPSPWHNPHRDDMTTMTVTPPHPTGCAAAPTQTTMVRRRPLQTCSGTHAGNHRHGVTMTTVTPPFPLPTCNSARTVYHHHGATISTLTMTSTTATPLPTCSSTDADHHHHGGVTTATALPLLGQRQRPRNNGHSTIPLPPCSRAHTDGHHHGTTTRVALPTAFTTIGPPTRAAPHRQFPL